MRGNRATRTAGAVGVTVALVVADGAAAPAATAVVVMVVVVVDSVGDDGDVRR